MALELELEFAISRTPKFIVEGSEGFDSLIMLQRCVAVRKDFRKKARINDLPVRPRTYELLQRYCILG